MRHASLGHRVDRAVGAALEGSDRTDGDDAALAPRHHFLCDRLAGQDGGEQVAVEHRAHVLFADADSIVRIGLAALGGDVAAGIVDENVDRAQLLRRGLDHARDVRALGEIAEHADGADAMRRCNLFGDRRQRRSLPILRWSILAHAVDRDIGAEACQPFGERAAKAATCAGDQRNLALERPRSVVCCHDVFS